MKLISMTDFVLEQEKLYPCSDLKDYNEINEKVLNAIINYAQFLKQPLKLEMFVPCDEDGNFLEEPIFHEPNNENEIGNYEKLIEEYYEAKDKVLFDNYLVIKKSNYSVVIDSHGRDVWLSWNQSKTIESLINEVTEVSLTPNAIKKIGL